MKVRLAFSVMSQLDEPILLVDEVLAVGDEAFREKCYRRIESLLADGRTLFLVSHSRSDLRRFCSRGLLLDSGRLVEDGPLTRCSIATARTARRGRSRPRQVGRPGERQDSCGRWRWPRSSIRGPRAVP